MAFAPLCDEDVMLVSFLNQCRYTAVLSVLSIIAIGFQNLLYLLHFTTLISKSVILLFIGENHFFSSVRNVMRVLVTNNCLIDVLR